MYCLHHFKMSHHSQWPSGFTVRMSTWLWHSPKNNVQKNIHKGGRAGGGRDPLSYPRTSRFPWDFAPWRRLKVPRLSLWGDRTEGWEGTKQEVDLGSHVCPLHHPATLTRWHPRAIRPKELSPLTDISCAANSARLFLNRFLSGSVLWTVEADIDAV